MWGIILGTSTVDPEVPYSMCGAWCAGWFKFSTTLDMRSWE